MSVNRTGSRTTQKIIRIPGDPLRIGIPTQRFFAKGEEQEATHYENAQLPPDDAPASDPEVAFESFDKIPKKRRPIVVIAAIGLLAGIGAWAIRSPVPWAGRLAPTSAATLINSKIPPAMSVVAVSATAPVAVPVLVSVPVSATAPAPVAVPIAVAVPVPVSATAPIVVPIAVAVPDRAPIGPQVVPLPHEKVAVSAMLADPVPAKRRARVERAAPLRGYVWSPDTQSLVPAGNSPVPVTDPEIQ